MEVLVIPWNGMILDCSRFRYTGVSFAYNTCAGLLGGMSPLICEWLMGKTDSMLGPAFYIITCAIVTSMVVIYFLEDKRGVSLAIV